MQAAGCSQKCCTQTCSSPGLDAAEEAVGACPVSSRGVTACQQPQPQMGRAGRRRRRPPAGLPMWCRQWCTALPASKGPLLLKQGLRATLDPRPHSQSIQLAGKGSLAPGLGNGARHAAARDAPAGEWSAGLVAVGHNVTEGWQGACRGVAGRAERETARRQPAPAVAVQQGTGSGGGGKPATGRRAARLPRRRHHAPSHQAPAAAQLAGMGH